MTDNCYPAAANNKKCVILHYACVLHTFTMDDETVLSLTKKRLGNLQKRSQNLEQIAVRLISKNLQYYLKSQDELEQLKNLPGVLRDIILNRVMKRRCLEESGNKEEFADLMEAFPLLLSARTRYIELNGILSFCPDRCENYSLQKVTACLIELLDCIASRAPKVEVLILRKHHAFDFDVVPEEASTEILDLLEKLQHLKRLHVELYMFDKYDLLDLCESVPSLQYLNVIINEDYSYPLTEDIKSCFANVKEFIYRTYKQEIDNLRSLMVRNLPNIEAVHFYCDVNCNKSTPCSYSEGHFSPMGYTEASKLKHLYVHLGASESEYGMLPDLFPHVSALLVEGFYLCKGDAGAGIIDSLLKFTKIKSLTLDHLLNEELHFIERFWTTYGENLRTLNLFEEARIRTVDLQTIFKHCPKLENLSLINIYWRDPSAPIDHFASLKSFEWKFLTWQEKTHAERMPAKMILSSILSAPELEKVDLDGVLFDHEDLRRVNNLIANRQILNKLCSFRLYFNYLSTDDFEAFKAATDIVKSACALLPRLTNVHFFASGGMEEFKKSRGYFNFRLSYPYYIETIEYRDPFILYRKKHDDIDFFEDSTISKLMNLFDEHLYY